MKRCILVIYIFLSVAFSAVGRDSLYHNISVAVSSGYNIPSHGFYRGHNSSCKPLYANTSSHLRYSFGFQPNTRLGRLFPGVTQGIGISGLTFYDHDLMGTPVLVYIFQNSRIADMTTGLGLDYKWEFGGSYGWQTNEVISTRANIYVSVGLVLSWDVTKSWTLEFGPEFSHFSNGDTRYPNGGANLLNFKMGLTGHIVQENEFSYKDVVHDYESQLRSRSFAERLEYDLILFGGWRAGKVTKGTYALINEAFPVFGLNFMPTYRFNRYLSAGLSLDVIADRSANLYDVVKPSDNDEHVSFKQPSIADQTAAGLSVRGEITMPIFVVGVGVGGFVLPNGYTLSGLYSIFSLKTFMNDHLFLNVSYRLSARNFTHNMMYGLGWRF